MTLQLYSIEHAPRSLPQWQLMIDDLGNPPARRVAQVLGIGERSVYRYTALGYAPRCPSLALFWLTRWGRSAVDAQAVNDAQLAVSYVRCLADEIHRLQNNVRHLSALSMGSANSPLIGGADGR